MRHTPTAILNHMPAWAMAAVVTAVVLGYLAGAWATRDAVALGHRKKWWRP